jgi:hypothetical protein
MRNAHVRVRRRQRAARPYLLKLAVEIPGCLVVAAPSPSISSEQRAGGPPPFLGDLPPTEQAWSPALAILDALSTDLVQSVRSWSHNTVKPGASAGVAVDGPTPYHPRALIAVVP